MSRFRTIFLGTPDFAVPSLQAIIEDSHFELLAVVTQPDRPAGRSMRLTPSPVRVVAEQHGVPVWTPESVNDSEVLERIRELRPETAVVVAYGQILKPEFLDIFPKKAVNLHASLLPRWRGAAPIQRALTEGDAESGVALQVIVPALDAGPVIGVRKMAIPSDMKADALYEKLKNMGPDLLKVDFLDYLRGQITPVEQDASLKTIAKKIKKEEGLVRWSQECDRIYNQFRGLYLWPGTWTLREGRILKIKSCRPRPELASGQPGDVISTQGGTLVVRCGTGALEIFEVQPESRGVMTVADYLKGYSAPSSFSE